MSAHDAIVRAYVDAERKSIEPTFVYFEAKLLEEPRATAVKLFDGARYFHPGLILQLQWTPAEALAKLSQIPLLDAGCPDVLFRKVAILAERVTYLGLAQTNTMLSTSDVEAFWGNPAIVQKIPATAQVARALMTLAPSSAAAERVFSILKLL